MKTSHKLLQLHPRKRGGAGNFAALSPAIVLGTVAAFEGFAEDFTALSMAHTGSTYAQIARKIGNWNNPSIWDLRDSLGKQFPHMKQILGSGPAIAIHKPPAVGS